MTTERKIGVLKTWTEEDIHRQSLVKTFATFQVNYFSFSKTSSHNNAGNLKSAKVPSFPKGNLGGVQSWQHNTHTHALSVVLVYTTLSEQKCLRKKGKILIFKYS